LLGDHQKIKRKVRQIKLMQDNLSLKLTLHLMKQINRQAKLILQFRIFDVLEGTFGSVMSAEGNVSVVDSTIL
jgi:hypothetical protein